MKALIDLYWTVQNFINEYLILGIPLDIFAHLFVAIILTLIFLKFRMSMKWVFVAILSLEIVKECIDWNFQVKMTMLESIKDVIVTMVYPSLIWYIRERKKPKT